MDVQSVKPFHTGRYIHDHCFHRSRCRPSWNPNTVVDEPGVCDGPGVLGAPPAAEGGGGPCAGPGGGGGRVGAGTGLPAAARATAPMPAKCGVKCGVVGLAYGEPGCELGARPRIRCTMNGGTLCEPDCDAPRWWWCVGLAGESIGEPGPGLGRGGCGGRCEPLRRRDWRRDSAIPENMGECVEWRKWMSETV